MRRYELRIGQRFIIPSAIAQGYEELFGKFSFVAEVVRIGVHHQFGVSQSVTRDLFLSLKDWGDSPYGEAKWYACYCLAHGHDKYGNPTLNWSPDLINGGKWFVPSLVKWELTFTYLWMNDVIDAIT